MAERAFVYNKVRVVSGITIIIDMNYNDNLAALEKNTFVLFELCSSRVYSAFQYFKK